MLKIALCDDNLKSIENIAKLMESIIIELDIDAEITTVTDNQNIIYDEIKNNNIDILFLDVDFQNGGKNGVEFATDLRKINKNFYLVFLTAHYEYSLLSFKCKTFDYLLKPISTSALTAIFNRFKEEFSSSENKVFINIKRGLSIRANDIFFIERKFNKTYIHARNCVYESSMSLNNIYKTLPNDIFIRNHRSYIINTEAITEVNKLDSKVFFTESISCPMGNIT